MSKKSDNFETPCNRGRRLGLSRSAKQSTEPATDTKVEYKSLEAAIPEIPEQQQHVPTTTPKSPKCGGKIRSVATTSNCRPYNLALSKRLRESLTKRRLEFHLLDLDQNANNEEVEDERSKPIVAVTAQAASETGERAIGLDGSHATKGNGDNGAVALDRADLIERIEEAKRKLRHRQGHEQRKRDDLQSTIEMWRNAFVLAMDDLQQSLEPAMATSLILHNLKIPQEMLKYLNE